MVYNVCLLLFNQIHANLNRQKVNGNIGMLMNANLHETVLNAKFNWKLKHKIVPIRIHVRRMYEF